MAFEPMQEDRFRVGRTWRVLRRTAIVIGLSCAAGCAPESSRSTGMPAGANAVVTAIVDDDTIEVDVGDRDERVRLIGIDTPEVAHPAFGDRQANAAECFGEDALRYTGELLTVGSGVRLERDVVARDDYGRLLAYVYRASDGAFVNYEIVRQGFAQPLTIAPNNTFAELFVEAARSAEHDDVGLWRACDRS
jgi:micrococcal nuclease